MPPQALITHILKLYKSKGIVLRTVKYAETSLIVSIYTELFGLQSYLVNGVRTSSKKGPGRANLFQPAAILDMVIYHQDSKNLQRIREFKWGHLYQNLFSDVIRHSVGLFMIEILQKCIRQPEPHPELFHFIEDIDSHPADGAQHTFGTGESRVVHCLYSDQNWGISQISS